MISGFNIGDIVRYREGEYTGLILDFVGDLGDARVLVLTVPKNQQPAARSIQLSALGSKTEWNLSNKSTWSLVATTD